MIRSVETQSLSDSLVLYKLHFINEGCGIPFLVAAQERDVRQISHYVTSCNILLQVHIWYNDLMI